jgi:hypothetical protein
VERFPARRGGVKPSHRSWIAKIQRGPIWPLLHVGDEIFSYGYAGVISPVLGSANGSAVGAGSIMVYVKGALSQDTARLMVFKLIVAAAKSRRRLLGQIRQISCRR